VDLVKVCEDRENRGVSEGDVDDAVVGEGAHGGNGSRFLTTAQGGTADEETSKLAPKATLAIL
jgi:hypothetical protein